MTLGTYTLKIDWIGDGAFTGASDDVSGLLLSVRTSRGRDYASQLVGRSIAGDLHGVLDNSGGTFNPFNTSSPIAGSMVKGRKVELKMNGNKIWSGQLRNAPEPKTRNRIINTATIQAWGPLGVVNDETVSVAYTGAETPSGSAIGTILDEAGWPAGDRDIDAGDTTLDNWWIPDNKGLTALRKVESVEGGFLSETPDRKIKFESRLARFSSPHTTPQAHFTDSPTGTLGYAQIDEIDPGRFIYTRIDAEYRELATRSISPLWRNLGAALKIEPKSALTIWASFPNADQTPSRIGVEAWTTPTAGDHYIAHDDADGTGNVITGNLAPTFTKFFQTMKMEFDNTGTVSAWLTTLKADGTALTQRDPVRVSADNATAGTLYGSATFRNTSPLFPTFHEADNWTRYQLGIYDHPNPIVRMSFMAHRDAVHSTAAWDLDLSDRITVTSTGTKGIGVDQDFWVEAIRHNVKRRTREHVVTVDLSPVDDFMGYWVLDVSGLGLSSRLAY